ACLLLVGGCALLPSWAAPPKLTRIGLLESTDLRVTNKATWQVFVDALQECGWVEGQNVLFEWRIADGDPARFPDLADELAKLPVDIISADGSEAAIAARGATTSIPIVFGASDPVATGLVGSLARRGGNATGIDNQLGAAIATKDLDVLK